MPQVSSPASGSAIASAWADEVADAINGMFPVGHVITGFFTSDPADYLILDGRELSRTGDYAALYAQVGPYGGPGDGVNTWTLPNMANRFPMAPGPAPSVALGGTGGSKDAAVVSHNHTQNSHNHTQASHDHTQDSHVHGLSHGHSLNGGSHAHAIDTDYGARLAVSVPDGAHVIPTDVGQAGQQVSFSDIDHENILAPGDVGSALSVATQTANSVGATANNQVTTAVNNAATAVNQAAGVSGTDANLPPYLALQFAVKYR